MRTLRQLFEAREKDPHTKLTSREYPGGKAYDVHHKGEHLGYVNSYQSTTRHVRGKLRAQAGFKSRTRWMSNPKQVEGQPFRRGDHSHAARDHAVQSLVNSYGKKD